MLSCLFYKKKRHCKAAESAKIYAQKKVKRPDLTPKNLKLWTEDQLWVVRGLKKKKLCHSVRRRKIREGAGGREESRDNLNSTVSVSQFINT